jgi:cell division protein FtsW
VVRNVLDRPLTSYHLVLGATGLLLVLGLLMVLSASSVLSYTTHNNDSYAIFYRQLIWVAVGLPMAYVASRMTPRHFRMLAYVALLGSVALLVLTYVPGLGVSGGTATTTGCDSAARCRSSRASSPSSRW